MDTWYSRLRAADRDTGDEADKAVGASKHARGKRKLKGWRQARKKRRKQAKASKRKNR